MAQSSREIYGSAILADFRRSGLARVKFRCLRRILVHSFRFAGPDRLYQTIDQFITVASFILLFLIQRSQSKGMLSLQVKLNELLAAAHRASHELINVEDRSESEVQEIHDRFQEIQQRGPGAHSIADPRPKEQASP
jgi:hypothetical protein